MLLLKFMDWRSIMHKTVYMCDYCGKDMGDSPEFTVMFKSNGLAVYESKE
jgi:hypothetical protein